MSADFKDILQKAAASKGAIAGFNVFSLAWAKACIKAAEETKKPVILMTNKAMVAHYGATWLGQNLSRLAKQSSAMVFVHLDHCRDMNIIKEAINAGYDSVMYDGSYLSLDENIANTKLAAKMAHDGGCLIEGEVGSVAYTDEPDSYTEHTSPDDALMFFEQTNVDILAVSVGSIHRSQEKIAKIDYKLLSDIEKKIDVALVMHGTSSLKDEDIQKLKRSRIAKFNLGTDLRLAYANAMRDLLTNTNIFDKLQLDKEAYEAVKKVAQKAIMQLGEDR